MKRAVFFVSLMRRHLGSYAVGAVLLGATLWMTFAIPRYLAEVIDLLSGSGGSGAREHVPLLGWIVFFALSIIVTRTGSRLAFFVPGRRVEFDLKNRLLAHLSSLPREYFLANPSGALISRMNNDVNGVRMLLGMGIMMLLTSLGTLSLAPYHMYQISPRLTLYCALPIIIGFVLLQVGLRRMRKYQLRQMAGLQRLSEFTVESFNGIDVLKAFRSYGWAESRFSALSNEVRDASIRMSSVRAYFMPLLTHITNALKITVLLVGGALVVREGMSIGDFAAYLMYLSMLVPPLMGMTFMMFVLQRGMTGLDSLLEVLEATSGRAAPDPDATLPAALVKGLRIDALTFAYPDDPHSPVLTDIDLEVRPGEVVGIFGAVGSGKTTLVNLINGYLEPPPRTVFLDDTDVRDLGAARVRAHVVTVTQEPFLFSETIRGNVTLAADEFDEAMLAAAEHRAALGPDLARMPAGDHTVVGEKGITLSGGQKQRVALARAAMIPCDLMLLDDVLSAVDHETERFLIERIYEFDTVGATVLVSHRVSALERADRILVLDAGRVVDQGSHAELSRRPGPYAEAVELQASGPDAAAQRDAPR